MRRLTLVLLLCILAVPACKSKKKRPPLEPAAEQSVSTQSSMIEVADPRASLQLIRGFHDVESGSWRWTERQFSATLRPPKDAARKGATLVLKFSIPEVVIRKLKPIQLSASVNGLAVPAQEYSKPGEYTYSRDVPSTALLGGAVRVDFALDKSLPPSPADERELGVVVSAVGFEAK
ncbi:MAG: hypothetical protein ACR2NN_04310 [Bryobacteraceae bacterium]